MRLCGHARGDKTVSQARRHEVEHAGQACGGVGEVGILADVKKTAGTITGRFSIKKADEDKHLAFGWAYVSQDEEGQQTEDWSGDQLEPSELEQAAHWM